MYMGYQEFIPWITNLKGAHSIDMINFAAIVGDNPQGCQSPWGEAERGAGASFHFTLWTDPALLAEAQQAIEDA